jgi:hypothetical protein
MFVSDTGNDQHPILWRSVDRFALKSFPVFDFSLFFLDLEKFSSCAFGKKKMPSSSCRKRRRSHYPCARQDSVGKILCNNYVLMFSVSLFQRDKLKILVLDKKFNSVKNFLLGCAADLHIVVVDQDSTEYELMLQELPGLSSANPGVTIELHNMSLSDYIASFNDDQPFQIAWLDYECQHKLLNGDIKAMVKNKNFLDNTHALLAVTENLRTLQHAAQLSDRKRVMRSVCGKAYKHVDFLKDHHYGLQLVTFWQLT